MVRPQGLFVDGEGPLQKGQGMGVIPQLPVGIAEVVQTGGGFRSLRPQDPLPHRQTGLEEGQGLGVVALIQGLLALGRQKAGLEGGGHIGRGRGRGLAELQFRPVPVAALPCLRPPPGASAPGFRTAQVPRGWRLSRWPWARSCCTTG